MVAPSASASVLVTPRLTVVASPAQAKIFVDGAEVPGNPFSATYSKGQSHEIRIVAPGFSPKSETIELQENTTVRISLEPSQSAPSTTASAPSAEKENAGDNSGKGGRFPVVGRPTANAPPAASPGENTGKTPPKSLNTNNPYLTGARWPLRGALSTPPILTSDDSPSPFFRGHGPGPPFATATLFCSTTKSKAGRGRPFRSRGEPL